MVQELLELVRPGLTLISPQYPFRASHLQGREVGGRRSGEGRRQEADPFKAVCMPCVDYMLDGQMQVLRAGPGQRAVGLLVGEGIAGSLTVSSGA